MRHFSVHPWLVVTAGLAVIAVSIGVIGTTGYLLLQDNHVTAAVAPARDHHQRRIYEERIATLRAQIDRITSQQVVARERVHQKVNELVLRQEQLARRYAEFAPTFDLNDKAGNQPNIPHPSPRPDVPVTGNAYSAPSSLSIPWPLRNDDEASVERSVAGQDQASSISQSLRAVERHQIETLHALTRQTYEAAGAINEALGRAGAMLDREEHLGGPFIPPDGKTAFAEQVHELDVALALLEDLTQRARELPLYNPISDAAVTSRYGIRRDPILGRKAYHSGVDFRARAGTPVQAAGPGKVVKAEWNGGYGRMVEIDHGGGIVTRYAHLSAIEVSKGARIEAGSVVGLSGSSGRSTGPHLHYEIRRKGKATDPMKFIEAGRRIAEYL
ncbi:M23 family metallopeptidase [Chelativorans sp. YIM 93263]|uniref:M23 family metallopeptidase n=1 Tax=Chelativorans sp. YIM 93263 TaxID=2906648 RepID=UPI002378D438|nr:M23 family metallopeptidase [Chelativorans sp. YIM 93263]